MADIRTSVAGAGVVPQGRLTPARSEAVKAAQRAFFQAALNGVEPVASPTQTQVVPTAPIQAVRAEAQPPSRVLRPGSLLDIKV